MTQETIGYVRLEWTCPSCGTRNPGPQKKCTNCGAAQPEDVRFEQAAEERLLTDQAEVARAAAGPDVHCPYCGTRNQGGAKSCSQCGGDLSGGRARESGRVLGAHRAGPAQPLVCPACGAQNPGTALQCSQCGAALGKPQPQAPPPPAAPARQGRLGIALGCLAILALAACTFFGLVLPRLRPAVEVVGQVRAVSWTRSIAIEQLVSVTEEGWRDEIPSGAIVGACTRKPRHTQKDPAPGAEKVCGTPYTVDQGSGYGKVVQDCQYRVYADWCQYQAREWQEVDEAELSGSDLSPRWPQVSLGSDRREGERSEVYQVTFDGDGKTYTYRLRDPAQFARFQVGSRWTLKTRGVTVESVEPAQ